VGAGDRAAHRRRRHHRARRARVVRAARRVVRLRGRPVRAPAVARQASTCTP
jgi:hypothetical protein